MRKSPFFNMPTHDNENKNDMPTHGNKKREVFKDACFCLFPVVVVVFFFMCVHIFGSLLHRFFTWRNTDREGTHTGITMPSL